MLYYILTDIIEYFYRQLPYYYILTDIIEYYQQLS